MNPQVISAPIKYIWNMILVTGGTGLLGSHLLYQLTDRGTPPRAIFRKDSDLEKVRKVFSYYAENPDELYAKIEWVKADLLDIPALESALEGVTQVYHCAGMVSMDPGDYRSLRRINIKGTANLVNVSLFRGVRTFCHVSSIATLGKPVTGDLVDEETALQTPVSDVYALSKHGAEMEVWRGSQEGLQVVIVNPGVILGPGFWENGSGYIIPRLAKGPRFYPPGGSGYIGVRDVAAIMVALMDKGVYNERFILVAENLLHKELLQMVSAEAGNRPPAYKIPSWLLEIGWRIDWLLSRFGKKRILTKHRARSMPKRVIYKNDKLQRVLAWKYTPIREVVQETLEKYRQG